MKSPHGALLFPLKGLTCPRWSIKFITPLFWTLTLAEAIRVRLLAMWYLRHVVELLPSLSLTLVWLAQLDNFAFPFDFRQGFGWAVCQEPSKLESESLNFAILLRSRWLSRSVWTMMNTKKMQLTSGRKKKRWLFFRLNQINSIFLCHHEAY